ncbi:MAG TPA: class I SAM-dependent methyltransferase [Myxococcota bacterium]|nr:class I SAM-dependent methyltransferase [Myxococcota bacterium]
MAAKADRHDLYQRAVQEPSVDVALIDRVFRKENGRRPKSLREDFCGTALISAAWAKSRKDRTALGVDLDGPTLAWGREHNVAPLGKAAARVTLLEKNVLDVTAPKVDAICAFNFSYCVFHERPELLRYFRAARRSLVDDGVFLLDNHAGSGTLESSWDEREQKRFTYIWEQKPVEALTQRSTRKIHFRFPDGSMLKNAFRYDWRIWSLAELIDLAAEAGFRRSDVYAEKIDSRGEPVTGLRRVKRYEHDESWTPYLVCWR